MGGTQDEMCIDFLMYYPRIDSIEHEGGACGLEHGYPYTSAAVTDSSLKRAWGFCKSDGSEEDSQRGSGALRGFSTTQMPADATESSGADTGGIAALLLMMV